MHRKVFNAIHVDKKVLNRDEPIINWVAAQGVDKAKFTEAYNSFGVSTKVRKATQLQDAYKLAGVPAMGIAGKYYTDGTLAQSMDRALVVTDYLVAEQRGKGK
jgi:thiol:disulfide interchange protein DsbA